MAQQTEGTPNAGSQVKTQRGHHPQHAKDAFTKEALARVAHTIADVEESTSAEIRVSIRDLREANEVGLPIHELAVKEFGTLGMHHADGRTGILLLVMYDERKFYVCGDEGVHSKVHPETWEDVAQVLREYFHKGMFEEGLHQALRKIEHHLKGVLPKRKSDNQHTDEVIVR